MSATDTIQAEDESRALGRRGQDVGTGLSATMLRGVRWLERRFEKRRSRRMLLELTDYQLKDIGITRADAHGEASRRFWD
jgi:uncharacterized protein YjiS (DUF1127 family)